MASCDPEPLQIRRLICHFQKPLIFRGLIDKWPMLKFTQSDWNNLFGENLLECRVGEKDAKSDEPQWERQSDSIKCTYNEFIKWSENCCDGDYSELSGLETSKHFLYYGYKYMKDIFDSEVLQMADWKPFGYTGRNGTDSTFWLGTAGAHTPCHYDTYGVNLVAQIAGRKRWVLYPPEDTSALQPTRIPYEESSVYSRINFEKWADSVPDIEGTHPHVVELGPGDVLFVPRHWWHHVRNEELSVSINTWIELVDEDHEARLHESLVKFFVAHTSRNLPTDVLFQLLNPNEEDVVDADLDEIQNLVRYSLKAASVIDRKNIAENRISDLQIPSEPWILPVTCSQLPSLDPKLKKARSDDAHSDIDALDVIRAFCHPRVIEIVSQILQGESKS